MLEYCFKKIADDLDEWKRDKRVTYTQEKDEKIVFICLEGILNEKINTLNEKRN